MADTETLLPIYIEKFEPTSPATAGAVGGRKRLSLATEHFAAGTTANEVCETVMKKYGIGMSMGLWLLQVKVDPDTEKDGADDGGYLTIKDSKYQLKIGEEYYVIHFSGSGMFLYS